MSDKEIKPSFSYQYFVLTIISTVIVTGIIFFVTKYLESFPTKNIVVYETQSSNIIKNSFPENKIEANYSLKGNPKKVIKSLFRKTFFIKNNGNEGIENLEITFATEGQKAILIDKPKIDSFPKYISNAISFNKIKNSSNNSKHVWNVNLLNKHESIIFEYYVYSEFILNDISFRAFPRQKNWDVTYENLLDKDNDESNYSNTYEFLTYIMVISILMLLAIIITLPIYYKEWIKNDDLKLKYETFYQYYMNHPLPIKQLFK
jgi:hypothetical protein